MLAFVGSDAQNIEVTETPEQILGMHLGQADDGAMTAMPEMPKRRRLDLRRSERIRITGIRSHGRAS